MPSFFDSSNSSCPCVVWSTGISAKLSSETIVTSVAPPRMAARAESKASFIRASVSPASSCASSSRPRRSAVRAASKATKPPPITTTRRPRFMR